MRHAVVQLWWMLSAIKPMPASPLEGWLRPIPLRRTQPHLIGFVSVSRFLDSGVRVFEHASELADRRHAPSAAVTSKPRPAPAGCPPRLQTESEGAWERARHRAAFNDLVPCGMFWPHPLTVDTPPQTVVNPFSFCLLSLSYFNTAD
jgi:hypothetical protein